MAGTLIPLPVDREPVVDLKTGKIRTPWILPFSEIVDTLVDTVVGPAVAADGQIALFSGVTGKILKALTGTGIVHVISGVASVSLIVETDLSFSDVATANTSTTKHGLAPKLDNNPLHFLNGQGGFSTPAGSGGTITGPVSSVIGHLATWGDTGGSQLLDGGAVPSGGSSGRAFAYMMGG